MSNKCVDDACADISPRVERVVQVRGEARRPDVGLVCGIVQLHLDVELPFGDSHGARQSEVGGYGGVAAGRDHGLGEPIPAPRSVSR